MRYLTALALLVFLAAPAAAQWVPTGGPAGGRLQALAAPQGALLAASPYVAVRYADGVWRAAEPGLGDMIAGGPRVLARTAAGLALSLDAGATFAALPATAESWRPVSTDGSALFAVGTGVDDSLHVSTDGGASWRGVQDSIWVTVRFGAGATSRFPVTLTSMAGAVRSGDAVLVAGTAYVFGGVYRHAPADTAWVPLFQPGAPDISAGVQTYALVRHGAALWVGHSGGVHRSDDDGATWTDARAGLPPSTAGYELVAGGAGLLARSRSTGALAVRTGSGWAAIASPPSTVFDLAVGDAVYASTVAGVVAYDAAGSAWVPLPPVVASSPVPIAAPPGALVVASDGQVLRSVNQAGSWASVLAGATGPFSVTPERLVAGTATGPRRSTDGGATWTALGPPALPPTATTTRPSAILDHGGALFSLHGYTRTGKHGVLLEQYGAAFRLPDGGASWTDVSAGLPATSLGRLPVQSGVAFPDGLVATTAGGCVRLADGATAWASAPCPGGDIRDVAEVGASRVVRTSTGAAVSADGGRSWQALAAGLPVPADPPAAARFWNSARFARTAAGLLLIADTGAGVRAFRLDGAAWTPTATTFPPTLVWTGFVETAAGTLYGGTNGQGLWRAAVPDASEPGAERTVALDVLGANPVRGAVRLRFALPAASAATLDVVDVLGRRVAVLVSATLGAGMHEAAWSGGAAPGLYVVRLTTPAGVVARAVTVVR